MTTASTPAPAGRTRLLYILASSHSGSTLLAMLLNTHPQICTAGELKATSLGDVARYRCSCLSPIPRCPFWIAVHADLAGQGLAFDLTLGETDIRSAATGYARWLLSPLHRGPALERGRDLALGLWPRWRAHLRRTQILNAALARAVCAHTGKPVIVDSSKSGVRLKYLLRNPAVDVRVIRLIRDGRAVALTYMDAARFADASDPDLRGGGMGGDGNGERLDMTAAAREWKRSNEEALAIVSRLAPSHWLEVRYEDLCDDTEGTLQRVFALAGVETIAPRPRLRSVSHHVIGNGMRFDTTEKVRLDDRWRDVLTTSELAVFDTVAGAMSRSLGYDSRRGPANGSLRMV